jgi:nicotinamide mononucleotide (NMN) deamidase PncC
MKDLVTIAEKIAARLTERRQTIAVAESSTGGLISAALLAVPAPRHISSGPPWSIRAMRGGFSWTSLMTQ